MITIKEITAEEAKIETEWGRTMPLWWQAVDKSINHVNKGPITRLGVFDSDLVAIYTLQEVGPKIIDAHLSCQRGVSLDVLVASAETVKQRLLKDGYSIILWPLRQNFALIRIAKAVGFKETGVRMLMGMFGKRPAEWVQLGVNNVH